MVLQPGEPRQQLGGHQQVGVGVGRRHPVLQPGPGVAVHERAHRDRAMVEPPGDVGRRERVAHGPLVAVGGRDGDVAGLGDVVHQTAQVGPPLLAEPAGLLVPEGVAARPPVAQALVHVQPAAGGLRPRLGHERGQVPVRGRDLLDRVAEEHQVVRCGQRRGVPQVDLHLARAVLRPAGLHHHAHGVQRRLDVPDHRPQVGVVVQAVDGVAPVARAQRLPVEQVELGLQAHVRLEPRLPDAVLRAAEHQPRVERDGQALPVDDVAEHQRRPRPPRHQPQGRRVRHQEDVRIAALPAVPARGRQHVEAVVEAEHPGGERELRGPPEDLRGDPLAPDRPHHVHDGELDGLDRVVVDEPVDCPRPVSHRGITHGTDGRSTDPGQPRPVCTWMASALTRVSRVLFEVCAHGAVRPCSARKSSRSPVISSGRSCWIQ